MIKGAIYQMRNLHQGFFSSFFFLLFVSHSHSSQLYTVSLKDHVLDQSAVSSKDSETIGRSMLFFKDDIKAVSTRPSRTSLLMEMAPSPSPELALTPVDFVPFDSPPARSKDSTKSKTTMKTGLLVAIISVIFILSLLGLVYKMFHSQLKERKDEEQWYDSILLLADSPKRFKYEDLKAATNNFELQRMLGKGGFGSVFEGILFNGIKIAVKRLNNFGQDRKDFLAEVTTTGTINHINLVKLVGFCAEESHRILVYDYMSNGSLDKWIFHKNERAGLQWRVRKTIILHIARGLAYLHEDCQKKIVHLDVKPQNVILDDKFNAKIADFGLAALIERDKSYAASRMRGTPGYLAPEWLAGKITDKADVYSFGVVVLEILFERKNVDCSREDGDNVLINMVRRKAETSQLHDLLDECSEDMQQDDKEVERMMKLALWCLQTDAKRRPSMSTVVKVLEGLLSVDIIGDYDIPSHSLTVSESQTSGSTSHISDCVLSGPR